MDQTQFWHIIEDAKRESRGDSERHLALIEQALRTCSAEEIALFEHMYRAFHTRSQRWQLFQALEMLVRETVPYRVHLGSNGFDVFRSWLIGQGEGIFREVTRYPERLREFMDPAHEWTHLEEIDSIAYEVYHEKTDRDAVDVLKEWGQEEYPLEGYEWLQPDMVEEEISREVGLFALQAHSLYHLHQKYVDDDGGVDPFTGRTYRQQGEEIWQQVQEALQRLRAQTSDYPILLSRADLQQVIHETHTLYLQLSTCFQIAARQDQLRVSNEEKALADELWHALKKTHQALYRHLG